MSLHQLSSPVYAVFCYGLSLGLGVTLTKALGLPNWFTPAIAFNNTTSYPLLLIQSLDATGIFSRLIVTDEKSSEAIERAKSYFLIFATIGDCLTFAVGPRLIDNEHAPDPVDDSVKQDAEHRREHEENRLLQSKHRSFRITFEQPRTGQNIISMSLSRINGTACPDGYKLRSRSWESFSMRH
jgi:predicted permease